MYDKAGHNRHREVPTGRQRASPKIIPLHEDGGSNQSRQGRTKSRTESSISDGVLEMLSTTQMAVEWDIVD